jgi:hypothetical protein
VSADDSRQAHELVTQAASLLDRPDEYGRAARLYREAAHLIENSPETVDHLIMAGHLSFYDGDDGDALNDLREGAEAALAFGDVATAAEAFLDAAWVAQHANRNRTAVELARRGERLANSPLLSQSDRVGILTRIADSERGPVVHTGPTARSVTGR